MRNLLACWLIVMVGCYTPKKADKHLAKAMSEYPEKVAGICKDEFPCKPGKTDTLEKVYYDLIEVECPPEYIEVVKSDTIEKIKTKVVTKLVKVPSKEIVITKYIIDSALVKVYQSEADKAKMDAALCKDRNKSRMNIIWALIAVVCLLTALLFIKHKK